MKNTRRLVFELSCEENLSSGFPIRSDANKDVQPQEIASFRLEISDLGSRGIVLSI